MNKLSRSPQRNTFQKERYLIRCAEEGKEPSEEYMDMFDKIIEDDNNKFIDENSKKNNMEYDLRTTDWILEKVRSSEVYAQNLYAAFCNNDFQKVSVEDTAENVVQVLRDGPVTWSCSWRYAGGIIADMREEGDYIDYYCSGINQGYTDEELQEMTPEQQERANLVSKFVSESVVTDEIREDLLKLGWKVKIEEDDLGI